MEALMLMILFVTQVSNDWNELKSKIELDYKYKYCTLAYMHIYVYLKMRR